MTPAAKNPLSGALIASPCFCNECGRVEVYRVDGDHVISVDYSLERAIEVLQEYETIRNRSLS